MPYTPYTLIRDAPRKPLVGFAAFAVLSIPAAVCSVVSLGMYAVTAYYLLSHSMTGTQSQYGVHSRSMVTAW